MREFKYIIFSLLMILTLFSGCEKRDKNGLEAIHWDRDMCERCKMVISERKYAAEVINPENKRVYKFDDIGCAVLWLKEEKKPWASRAKIFVTDAKSGKWIDAKKALYTDDSITPMAYGISAFSDKTFPKGHNLLKFEDAIKKIEMIEKRNNELRESERQ